MQRDVEVLKRKASRERAARIAAETLLEGKSRENYAANQQLRTLAEQLRKQGELTSAIVETAADGIIVFNGVGQIVSANPAAERIFQYSHQAMLDRNVIELFDTTQQCWEEANELHVSGEYIGLRSDGETFSFEWTVSNVDKTSMQLWTAFVRDNTDRKRLQLQLSHAQKLESVGLLAAGVAHEINTPIQFVGDNIHFLSESFESVQQLLVAYQDLESAVRQQLSTTRSLEQIDQTYAEVDMEFLKEEIPSAIAEATDGITRVARIIKAMKEFSHPGAEQRCNIDLNRAIESTITVSRNEWKYVARMETDLDPNLPLVKCYPGELNQALLNLIVNAAHAVGDARESSSDRTDFFIRITTKTCGQSVVIEVTDTGIGIAPENVEKIFTPFFTTKGIGVGTGQGLAIVQSVIVKHGGTVDVESNQGQGSTFRISLPYESTTETWVLDDSSEKLDEPNSVY